MGFYGSTSSSSKANLTFDITYSSRAAMEDGAFKGDGVYAGRFVLVEYGITNTQPDKEFILYRSTDNKFYLNVNFTPTAEVKQFTQPFYWVLGPNSQLVDGVQHYEIWVSSTDGTSLIKISDSTATVGYTENYLIDKKRYAPNDSAFRGYDSTVWQKVYEGSTAKYVMIAELNSIIPTFSMKVDAPQENPVAPHFDSNDTNVFYSMHMAPNWGFRVKGAGGSPQTDAKTKHNGVEVDAAIYYNKAGFNPRKVSRIDTEDNYIKLEPTGVSNQEYEDHSGRKKTAPDIQEFSLYLPQIGNMMSEGWDVIYGPDRDEPHNNSLQGILNFFQGKQAVASTDSEGNVVITYQDTGIKEGQIPVYAEDETAPGLTGASLQGDAWISPTADTANRKIIIEHTYNPGNDTTSTHDVNGNGDTIDLYTPILDSNGHVIAKNTQTVTLPYGFKTIAVQKASTKETNPTANASTVNLVADSTQDTLYFSPANKWIRFVPTTSSGMISIGHQVNNITETPKSNTSLDGVGAFTVQDLEFDDAGHVTKNQAHTYNLPFNIRNIQVGTASSEVKAGESASDTLEADVYNDTFTISPNNRWITLKADANNDTIYIGHAAAGNEATTAGDTGDVAPKFGESFKTPYVKYDEMGHIKTSGTRTVTLPKGDLTSTSSSVGSVITTLGFDAETGVISETHQNAQSLLLTGYTASSRIASTNTIGGALTILDNYLDSLDYADDETTNEKIITKVVQVDGKISVERAAAGTLVLGDAYTSPHSKIATTDSLNSAFGKVETELYDLNTRINDEVNNLTDKINLVFNDEDTTDLDSVVDLINWVDEHKETVSDIITSIQDNDKDIAELVKEAQDQAEDIDNIVKELKTKNEEIATLQSTITALTSRIAALEEMCQIYPMPEETPVEGDSGDSIT